MSNKDNESYWIERHVKLKDDIRSVGNLGKDIQTNTNGYVQKNKMLQAAIESTMASIKGKHVLEVGCGIGMMANTIIKMGANYTGIDISEVALQKAQEICPAGKYVCHNIINYDLHEKFDLIFCTDVLVHLVKDENWMDSLANMKKHLKPDGVIIIKEEIYAERRNPAPHVVSRSLYTYDSAFGKLGFKMRGIPTVRNFYKINRAET